MSFHHHDVVGAKLARKRLTALRFSKDEIEAVAELIFLHLRFHGYSRGWRATPPGPTPPYAAMSATPATSSSGCTS